ncbi:MAG: hypothetical protein CHKLHMKO_00062 [Candidatus Argoarchaeum ethanivorans]|uniref:Uncharacterized protein n=1 Tax=Candidatus Argoarchaeum ethanivorans TaxID=2608793 RepID=A0A811T425_9EURY|nr:MAG: hypothetical protein CHKLHMKO_00062 [Candidatus Argoarchaeum ethanivorans]
MLRERHPEIGPITKVASSCSIKKSFAVNQVSKETGLTKGLVSRCLNYLNTAGLLNRFGHSYRPDDNAHNASVDDRAVTRAVKVLLNLNKLNIGSLDHGWAAGTGVSEGKGYTSTEEGVTMFRRTRFLRWWVKEVVLQVDVAHTPGSRITGE